MKCRELVRQSAVTVRAGDSVLDAILRMRDANVGFLPVIDDYGSPVGVLTDRDVLVRVLAADSRPSEIHVDEVASHRLVTCALDDDVSRARKLMADFGVWRLLVVKGGTLHGVISLADIADSVRAVQAGQTLRGTIERGGEEPRPEAHKGDPHAL